MSKDPTKLTPILKPLHRVTVNSWSMYEILHDTEGKFVFWEDVADLVVEVAGLIARIEMSHDTHAVSAIKGSKEFAEVKHLLSEVFKTKGP
jgi:hypothetical protein